MLWYFADSNKGSNRVLNICFPPGVGSPATDFYKSLCYLAPHRWDWQCFLHRMWNCRHCFWCYFFGGGLSGGRAWCMKLSASVAYWLLGSTGREPGCWMRLSTSVTTFSWMSNCKSFRHQVFVTFAPIFFWNNKFIFKADIGFCASITR